VPSPWLDVADAGISAIEFGASTSILMNGARQCNRVCLPGTTMKTCGIPQLVASKKDAPNKHLECPQNQRTSLRAIRHQPVAVSLHHCSELVVHQLPSPRPISFGPFSHYSRTIRPTSITRQAYSRRATEPTVGSYAGFGSSPRPFHPQAKKPETGTCPQAMPRVMDARTSEVIHASHVSAASRRGR